MLVISIIFIFIIVIYTPLSNWIWSNSMKRKLEQPIVGIISHNGCPSSFTDFTPQDWRDRLNQLSLRNELISVSQINGKYAAIINPCGEVYPEEELLTLKTFDRIKKYLLEGGLFLCAGGLAFFYGGDLRAQNRMVALADELPIYIPVPLTPQTPPNLRGALEPAQLYPPRYTLVETPLRKNFGVVTTWRDTERNQCFQQGDDREFVGDIANQGGIDEVLHFRAVREPIRRCIPFLRVQPRNWLGDVYAIAGVPYGKGCLILNSFDLRDNRANPQWNAQIHRAHLEKMCVALRNILENRRNGNKSLNAEDW